MRQVVRLTNQEVDCIWGLVRVLKRLDLVDAAISQEIASMWMDEWLRGMV